MSNTITALTFCVLFPTKDQAHLQEDRMPQGCRVEGCLLISEVSCFDLDIDTGPQLQAQRRYDERSGEVSILRRKIKQNK